MSNRVIQNSPFIRLDFNSGELANGCVLLTDISEVIATYNLSDVIPCLERAVFAQRAGAFVAGFITYEAAAAFDPALTILKPDPSLPLVWFGVCQRPIATHATDVGPVYSSNPTRRDSTPSQSCEDRVIADTDRRPREYEIGEWMAKMSYGEYTSAFLDIKKHLKDGDTYQVNLTFPLEARFSGSVASYYNDLKDAQSANYCAWIHTQDFDVLSLSPELFFHTMDGWITTRPMKGTRSRGINCAADQAICSELALSPKDRAENVMIVDLLRNDLGRIAAIGSVNVTSLFDTEIYPTIIQMTSTIRAKLRESTTFPDILKALFPSGSIVGAPKVKTMELITQYESRPRGVYCGSVGYLSPTGEIAFNVAIRTLTLKPDGMAAYAVGSGVVANSDSFQEYDECLEKSKLLKRVKWPEFQLLETLLFRADEGFYLLKDHLDRMQASANYFGFRCDIENIEKQLLSESRSWRKPMKVRLLVSRDGALDIQANPIQPENGSAPPRVAFAKTPVLSDDPFLYHKTTHRSLYERRLREANDIDDVILYNEKGEITESTIANIAVKLGETWVTPPVSCGLLAGTKRAELLRRRELIEKTITKKDILHAEKIKFFNSVRDEYLVELSHRR